MFPAEEQDSHLCKKVWIVDSNTPIGTGNRIPNWVGKLTALDKQSSTKEKIQMMQDFRNEVQQFLTSEVGQATVRGPLALGVASGALLLSQAVHTPSAEAQFECYSDSDCGSEGVCVSWCAKKSNGTCTKWHSGCN